MDSINMIKQFKDTVALENQLMFVMKTRKAESFGRCSNGTGIIWGMTSVTQFLWSSRGY